MVLRFNGNLMKQGLGWILMMGMDFIVKLYTASSLELA
jgi:hypothetical protein